MIDYDPHDWRDHLLDVRGSMVREIFARVASCVAWSCLVVITQHRVLPEGWSIAIPETQHSLVGLAISLLLVFRTNSSYDRFWEGRKQWGAIVNETRNLARGASVALASTPQLLAALLRWTVLFPRATMERLRNQDPSEWETDLPSGAVAGVKTAINPPLAITCRMTELLDEARVAGTLSEFRFVALDQNIQQLVDYLGACERIHNTPMPFAYMVHLRRALIAYCYTLPFALVERFGWLTIPGTFVLAFILLGIEEIGVEIEDPFGSDENDLPLERICNGIEQTVLDFLPTTSFPGDGVGARRPAAAP